MRPLYTIDTTTAQVRYAGNGSTTVFAVEFQFFEPSTLRVRTAVGATVSVKVLDTDYTVAGGDGETGAITFMVAPPSGTNIIIDLNIPMLQQTIDLAPNGPLPAEDVEQGFDRIVTMVKQLRQQLLAVPELDATFNPDTDQPPILPPPSNGKILVGREDELGWENADAFSTEDLPTLISLLADQDLLEYDLAGLAWRNRTLATVLGRMLTTRGDILLRGASTVARLPIGAANRFLKSNGTDLAYGQVNLAGTDVTGVLPAANGGFVAPRGYYEANTTGWTLSSSFSTPFVISEGTQVFSKSYTAAVGQTVVVEVDVSGVEGQNATASTAIFFDGATNCVAQSDMQFTNTATHKGPNRVVYGYVSDGNAHTISVRIAGSVNVDRAVLVIREFLV